MSVTLADRMRKAAFPKHLVTGRVVAKPNIDLLASSVSAVKQAIESLSLYSDSLPADSVLLKTVYAKEIAALWKVYYLLLGGLPNNPVK